MYAESSGDIVQPTVRVELSGDGRSASVTAEDVQILTVLFQGVADELRDDQRVAIAEAAFEKFAEFYAET